MTVIVPASRSLGRNGVQFGFQCIGAFSDTNFWTSTLPYFAAIAEWYATIRVGVTGGELQAVIDRHLGDPFFGIFLNRKNVIVILMSIELMMLAVNINLVAFSAFHADLVGQVFTMIVLTVAAAEAAIGLAIVVVYFRNRGTIDVASIRIWLRDLTRHPPNTT